MTTDNTAPASPAKPTFGQPAFGQQALAEPALAEPVLTRHVLIQPSPELIDHHIRRGKRMRAEAIAAWSSALYRRLARVLGTAGHAHGRSAATSGR